MMLTFVDLELGGDGMGIGDEKMLGWGGDGDEIHYRVILY